MAEKNGHKKMRLTIISALNQNTLQVPATFYFEGYCTRELFEIYIERILLPHLKPGQTVVFDNASFHKGGRIEGLIQAAGCFLEYLPPYSPDLNPIEHFWFAVKNSIRKILFSHKNDLFHAAQTAFDNICHAI
jgi:transposase